MNDETTLGEARTWLREQAASKGASCPCCTQFTRVYKRKLNSGMARWMIRFYRKAGTSWEHFRVAPNLGGEWSLLSHWNLIESHPDKPGFTRLTDLGQKFVCAVDKVSSHAVIFNGKLIRLTGDEIGIKHALGDHFDYDELMSETYDG